MKKSIVLDKLVYYYRPIVIASAILAIYFSGYKLGLFDIPSLKTRDLFFELRYKLVKPTEGRNKIVIIAADDSAYSSYGRKWPWERKVFTALIYKIIQYNPAVIAFDLIFRGASAESPDTDLLFIEALKSAGNVILSAYFSDEGEYILPYKDFCQNAKGYGFTNKPEDLDHVVRETNLFFRDKLRGNIIDFSFELKIVAASLGYSIDDINYNGREIVLKNSKKELKMAVPEDGVIPINYFCKLDDFKIFPFGSVMNNKVDLNLLRDKIVLIGLVGEVFREMSFTPLAKMPEVGVIANNIVMLTSRSFLREIPLHINILFILFAAFLAGLVVYEKGIYRGALSVLLILAGFIGISMIFILNNIVWDFFSIPVIVVSVYLISEITNYVNLFMQSINLERLAATDTLTGLPTRRYFLMKLDKDIKRIKKGKDIALVFFAIDDYDSIFAEAGEEKASRIIKEAGGVLRKFSRRTRGFDFIARYGENEFCTILYGVPAEGALAYANRISKIAKDRIKIYSPLTLSAGIAALSMIEERSSKLLARCAHAALKRAGDSGFGKITVYNKDIEHIPLDIYKDEKKISEVDLNYVAEELEEKNRELMILLNKLHMSQEEIIMSERLSAVGKVAATIHHDLAKPIHNLGHGLVMIKNELNKMDLSKIPRIKELLDLETEEITRLSELAYGLKDLYRPLDKEISSININPILEDMLSLAGGEIIKNHIKLVKGLSENLPFVRSNAAQLKQAFLNLIINGIESIPQGGELYVSSGISPDKKNMIEVVIKDTGCGIAPEDLDKIFKGFFTTRKKEKGAGLGLFSSLEIVKRYGGTIEASSVVGKGSTFKVLLPVAISE